MFCPECGNRIEDQNIHFCPECGARIEQESNTEKKAPVKPHPQGMSMHGLIFTNLGLLAEKTGTDEQSLMAIFDANSLMRVITRIGKVVFGATRKKYI